MGTWKHKELDYFSITEPYQYKGLLILQNDFLERDWLSAFIWERGLPEVHHNRSMYYYLNAIFLMAVEIQGR